MSSLHFIFLQKVVVLTYFHIFLVRELRFILKQVIWKMSCTCLLVRVIWIFFNLFLEHFIKDYDDNNRKMQYTFKSESYRSQVFYKYEIIFLHAMDIDGNTYLHLAAKKNQTKICKLLMKYDTEIITLLNKKGKPAREVAKDKDHTEVLNALKVEYDRAGMFS